VRRPPIMVHARRRQQLTARRDPWLEWCDLHHSTTRSACWKPWSLTLRKRSCRPINIGMSTLKNIMAAPGQSKPILNFWTTLSSTYCLYQKAAPLPFTTDKAPRTETQPASRKTSGTALPSCRINGSEKKNRYAKSLSVTLLA
jgi:hypothetical protein